MKYIIPIVLVLLIIGAGAYFYVNNRSAFDLASQQETATPEEQSANTQNIINSAQETDSASAEIPATCPATLTTAQTEGPYYTAGSPQKTDLTAADIPGEPLTVTGYVYDQNCQPIANAWIDFWQADGNGKYDNAGYKLRGHQFTDQNGTYTLKTVIPGEYPGRTNHIHVKLRATESSPVVTSQLYFPGATQNNADSIFVPSMTVTLNQGSDQQIAYFNFKIQK
jgi:protocatechuate 3,4-dioxygenase beta subunit